MIAGRVLGIGFEKEIEQRDVSLLDLRLLRLAILQETDYLVMNNNTCRRLLEAFKQSYDASKQLRFDRWCRVALQDTHP